MSVSLPLYVAYLTGVAAVLVPPFIAVAMVLLIRGGIRLKAALIGLASWTVTMIAAISYALILPWDRIDWSGDEGAVIGFTALSVVVMVVVSACFMFTVLLEELRPSL